MRLPAAGDRVAGPPAAPPSRLDPRRAGRRAGRRHRTGCSCWHAEDLSVAAAFDLSYGELTAGQQRLFRRLGLHPGPDIDAYVAAALDGSGLAAARAGLEALYDQYLLTEPARGRYRMHDLIREHARALAGGHDPGDGSMPSVGCWTTTSTPPPRSGSRPAGPRVPAEAVGAASTESRAWSAGNRRWHGPAPSGPPCWPACTMLPRPASTPGSSR